MYAHLLLCLFLEVEIALVSFLGEAGHSAGHHHGIQSWMDRNYASAITLDALSKQFGISKYHMSREFKRSIGKARTTT